MLKDEYSPQQQPLGKRQLCELSSHSKLPVKGDDQETNFALSELQV